MRCGKNGDGRRSGKKRFILIPRLGRIWEIFLTTFMCEDKGNVKDKYSEGTEGAE